jgi:DNA polymerase I-like protein with 3'-5' exonuclease and polymerase domains
MGMTINRGTKADYESYVLDVCKVCGGAPRETRWAFNANSPDQMKILLYDILKLPKRFSRNGKGQSTLTVDEQALKGLLAGIEA